MRKGADETGCTYLVRWVVDMAVTWGSKRRVISPWKCRADLWPQNVVFLSCCDFWLKEVAGGGRVGCGVAHDHVRKFPSLSLWSRPQDIRPRRGWQLQEASVGFWRFLPVHKAWVLPRSVSQQQAPVSRRGFEAHSTPSSKGRESLTKGDACIHNRGRRERSKDEEWLLGTCPCHGLPGLPGLVGVSVLPGLGLRGILLGKEGCENPWQIKVGTRRSLLKTQKGGRYWESGFSTGAGHVVSEQVYLLTMVEVWGFVLCDIMPVTCPK